MSESATSPTAATTATTAATAATTLSTTSSSKLPQTQDGIEQSEDYETGGQGADEGDVEGDEAQFNAEEDADPVRVFMILF